MTLEEFEVTLGNVELRLNGEVFVFVYLAESGHDAVGAHSDGNHFFNDRFSVGALRNVVEITDRDFVSKETLDSSVEISGGGLRLCGEREGGAEDPAVGERFLKLDGFVFAAGGDDANHGFVALAGHIAVGIFENEEDLFADVRNLSGLEVFFVGDLQSGGREERGLGAERIRIAIGAGGILVTRSKGVGTDDIEDSESGGVSFGAVVEFGFGVIISRKDDFTQSTSRNGAIFRNNGRALGIAQK